MTPLKQILVDVEKNLGPSGMIISGSKSGYRHANPAHVVVFNGNVVIEGLGKVWHGDIDLSLLEKEEALTSIVKLANGKKVYVLSEMAARFENEAAPDVSLSYWTGFKDDVTGMVKVSYNEEYYVRDQTGRLMVKQESAESILDREMSRVAADRISMSEDDFLPLQIPFPYDVVLASAKSRRKNDDHPLIAFINEITAATVGMDLENAHLLAVIHADDNEVLERSTFRRIKREYAYLSDYGVDKEVSWMMFQYGPRSFSKGGTPDPVARGTIRLRKPNT